MEMLLDLSVFPWTLTDEPFEGVLVSVRPSRQVGSHFGHGEPSGRVVKAASNWSMNCRDATWL